MSENMEPSVPNVMSSITKKFRMKKADPGQAYTVCIYRVSRKYRKANEEAYTPRLISIGPLHHGKSELQAMESYKVSSFRAFSERNQVDVQDLVKFTAKETQYVRDCYEDTTKFSPDEFTEMILLDGIFVLELLLKNHLVHQRDIRDAIYENKWMQSDMLHDMLLLENQLPISFLLGLFQSFVKYEYQLNFYNLVLEYFENVGNTKKLGLIAGEYWKEARHLVDFLVYLHWPTGVNFDIQNSHQRRLEEIRSATELVEAGVRFEHAEESCLFDVSFTENGVLRIPQLTVNENTETFFRNSIAFEQCGYYGKHITSYVILMDNLINTKRDVDLLVHSQILVNHLGDSEKVANLFNNLYKEVVANDKDFYFSEICDNLNAFSKDKWHQWKSMRYRWNKMLMRDYFGNPWSFLSLVAACILLALTIIQTVCSMISI